MNKLTQMLIRTLGVILFAFIPGMAVGGPTVGWFWGGITGVLTVLSSIVIFFGIQLAWAGTLTDKDIEKGFRNAVAKAAEDDPELMKALEVSKDDEINFDDINWDADPDSDDGDEGDPEADLAELEEDQK